MSFKDVTIQVKERSRASSRGDDVEKGPPDHTSVQLITDNTPGDLKTCEGAEEQKMWIFRAVKSLKKLRYWVRLALYFLPLAVALAVAFSISRTVFKSAHIGHAELSGIFLWLEISWCSLWVLDHCVWLIALASKALCQPRAFDIDDYEDFVRRLKVPITIFLWSVVTFLTRSTIYHFHHGRHEDNWYGILSKVLVATSVVSGIFLGKQALVELIRINYRSRFIQPRKRALKEKVYIFEEMIRLSSLESEKPKAASTLPPKTRCKNSVSSFLGHLIFKAVPSEETQRWETFLQGQATPEEREKISKQLWGARRSLDRTEMKVLIRRATLELGTSRCKAAPRSNSVVEKEIKRVFNAVDKNGNDEIDFDELGVLVKEVGEKFGKVEQGLKSLEQVVKSLDRILSAVVVIAIGVVYAAFFSQTFTTHLTAIWSTVVGASFAFANLVTEFFGACFFVFDKHPYDVRDEVSIEKVRLEVLEIYLMHTVFRRMDDRVKVQIPHTKAQEYWIDNISRTDREDEEMEVGNDAKRDTKTTKNKEQEKDTSRELDGMLKSVAAVD